MTLLAILVIAGCAWWLHSDLKRRVPKGWSLPVSIALPTLVCMLTTWVAGLLVGWIPLLGGLAELVGASATILFTAGFAVPLSRQLRARNSK